MRQSAVAAMVGALLLALPAALHAQEQIVQDGPLDSVHHVAPAEGTAETVVGAELGVEESEGARQTLRRAEAAFAMTGDDVKEIAVGPDGLDGMPARDNLVIPATTVIIALLVLIVILVA